MSSSLNNKRLRINLLILLLIRGALLFLNKVFSLYVLIFSINQNPINLILNALIIISILRLINPRLNRTLKSLVNFIAITFITMSLLFSLIFNTQPSYFYFPSPNSSKTLVVKEGAFFKGGIIRFYERKGLILVKDLKVVESTDDNYRPFSSNSYGLTWISNDSVEVTYGYGEGVYKNVSIELD